MVILVDAPGFDTSSPARMLRSLFGWRSMFRKGQGVGHAWLAFRHDERAVEGGHTGEYGLERAPYVTGVLAGIRAGVPDPVAYLWEGMEDGRFHTGSDGHRASYWCRFALDEEQARRVLGCIESYDYGQFSLRGHLCTDFVVRCAAAAGIELGHQAMLRIPPVIERRGQELVMWTDPAYSTLTIGLPDVLQESLRLAHGEGLCSRRRERTVQRP